jgi:hypothetical protein
MVYRALLATLLAITLTSFLVAESNPKNGPIEIPEGTTLHTKLAETLTTKLNYTGDPFSATIFEPITLNNRTVIPAGSTLQGRISILERPGRITGVGMMRLAVDRIAIADGRTMPLTATLVMAPDAENATVESEEGVVKAPTTRFRDAKEIIAGTAGGGVLGLLLHHPWVGVTVGGAVMVADTLRRRGKDLTLPTGTQLDFRLAHDLAIAQ